MRALSRDGRALACLFTEHGDEQVLLWGDLAHGNRFLPEPAPEWPRKYEGDWEDDPNCSAPICRAGRRVVSPLRITSMQFPPEGDAIVYTYYGLSFEPLYEQGTPQHGWRLERWTPGGSAKRAGRVDRLAQSPDTLCAKLLAVSAGGGLAVLGGEVVHASVRRAPRYDAEPLGQDAVALAAALSPDGARILTGHPDGRLRLWDARTLALIATSD